jgi:hypothetical protein
MGELIALPPGVELSPFWDWSPGAIAFPIWLGVLILLTLAIAGPNIWWVYKYLIMRPVAGHGEAARSGNEKTQQVLLFGLNRAFAIHALEYAEKVLAFEDPQRIGRWLQTSPYAVGMLGYKSIMLVMETFDIVKDPIAEMAICTACHNHNELNPDKVIEDYNGFRRNRALLESENPDGVDIPIYSIYNPGKIYQFTPVDRTSGQFGRTCLKDANDLNQAMAQQNWIEKYVPVFLCLVFGIIAIALVFMYVTSGDASAATALPTSAPVILPTSTRGV